MNSVQNKWPDQWKVILRYNWSKFLLFSSLRQTLTWTSGFMVIQNQLYAFKQQQQKFTFALFSYLAFEWLDGNNKHIVKEPSRQTLSEACLRSKRIMSSIMSGDEMNSDGRMGDCKVHIFAPCQDQHSVSAGFSKLKERGESCPLLATLSLKSVKSGLEAHAAHATHASHATHSSSGHLLLLLGNFRDDGFCRGQERRNTCSI